MTTLRKTERQNIIEAAGFTCAECGNQKEYDALEVHEVSPTEHRVLCRSCHRALHVRLRKERELKRSKRFVEIDGERFRLTDVRLKPLIVRELKEHPFLKYGYLARKYYTTVGTIKNIVWRARKEGLLPPK